MTSSSAPSRLRRPRNQPVRDHPDPRRRRRAGLSCGDVGAGEHRRGNSVNASGLDASDHFRSAAKLVTLGSGARREIADVDAGVVEVLARHPCSDATDALVAAYPGEDVQMTRPQGIPADFAVNLAAVRLPCTTSRAISSAQVLMSRARATRSSRETRHSDFSSASFAVRAADRDVDAATIAIQIVAPDEIISTINEATSTQVTSTPSTLRAKRRRRVPRARWCGPPAGRS